MENDTRTTSLALHYVLLPNSRYTVCGRFLAFVDDTEVANPLKRFDDVKNLTVCSDCEVAASYMHPLIRREHLYGFPAWDSDFEKIKIPYRKIEF